MKCSAAGVATFAAKYQSAVPDSCWQATHNGSWAGALDASAFGSPNNMCCWTSPDNTDGRLPWLLQPVAAAGRQCKGKHRCCTIRLLHLMFIHITAEKTVSSRCSGTCLTRTPLLAMWPPTITHELGITACCLARCCLTCPATARQVLQLNHQQVHALLQQRAAHHACCQPRVRLLVHDAHP